jgi:hypothetical protein
MTGVGRVFEWFRNGSLDGDDEVAILHAPEALHYEPATVALVEIRHALTQLMSQQRVSPEAVSKFIHSVKQISFGKRTVERLRALARQDLGECAARDLEQAVSRYSIKEADARLALELAVTPARRAAKRELHETGFLNYFKEVAFRPAVRDKPAVRPSLAHAWNMAQLFHPAVEQFVQWLRLRYLLFSSAAHSGLDPPRARQREVARRLRRHHTTTFGAALLPDVEYDEEARVHVMAETACEAFGGATSACGALAERLAEGGVGAKQRLLILLSGQPDVIPVWWHARAFAFTPALGVALDLAAEAEEIHRCFRKWSGGARVAWDSLVEVGATLWGCGPSDVIREGIRRGLFLAPGPSDGLREALELVAAGERMLQPINAYPEMRRRLVLAPLHPFIDLPLSDAPQAAQIPYGVDSPSRSA